MILRLITLVLVIFYFARSTCLKLQNIKPVRQLPRPHQVEAISAGTRSFQRGQIVMPGGSGKTYVGMKIIEEKGRNGISCVCLPQLNLLEQTLSSYKSFMGEDWIDWENDVLCIGSKICFDDIRRTTGPDMVRQFIEEKGEAGPKLILSTYHSAVSCLHGCKLDLLILDEAHYAGGGGVFTGTLLDSEIRADKRVLMSATPRARPSVKNLFGDVVYNLPYKEAVDRNIRTPLRLIAYELKDEAQALYIPKHNTISDAEREREFKALILENACKEFGFRKVITFSRLNKRAKGLWEALERVEGIGKNLLVNSTLSTDAVRKIYGQIRAPVMENDGPLVVNNCHLLSTGFDVPDCDCVYLADEMHSEVNIL